MRFLVSAGEASGDFYAADLVAHLRKRYPSATFAGCAGPRLQAAGVEPVIDAKTLSVVGLAEVVAHLPRIFKQYRRLVRHAERYKPDAAILADNPDFHLRLARHLKRLGVPVFYLVAPQVWAWRQGRVRTIRKLVDKLFCLFPFEEPWFRDRGVEATYIGHPLASMARVRQSRADFFGVYGLPADRKLVVLLPGSRVGEARRHLPILLDAVKQIASGQAASFVLATPPGFDPSMAFGSLWDRIRRLSIQVIENDTWDCVGHADLALAASGTVTVEAAILGTPMVTFYRVTPLSWYVGRHLVKVPFFTMVNLISGRKIVPELIQNEMTPANIAAEADRLLSDESAANAMRSDLAELRKVLAGSGHPLERAANLIGDSLASKGIGLNEPDAVGRK